MAGSAADELPLEIEEFLVWMTSERGRTRNTVLAYRRDLRRYHAWLADRGSSVLSVGYDDLVDFVDEHRSAGAASSSVARQIAAIRMLHRYLATEQYRPDDPTARLDGVRVPSGIPKPLTEAQVTSLLDAVIGTEPMHRRDRALLELLYATGARVSEVVGLSLGDFDFDEGLVRVYGKGGKERIVPYGSAADPAKSARVGRRLRQLGPEPALRRQQSDHRLGVGDLTAIDHRQRVVERQVQQLHRLFLGPVPSMLDRGAAGREEDRADRVGHARRRQHVDQMDHLARLEARLLDELPATGLCGRLPRHVAHPGGDLDHLALVGRPVLAHEHDRREALRVEHERHDTDRTRRPDDVAPEPLT